MTYDPQARSKEILEEMDQLIRQAEAQQAQWQEIKGALNLDRLKGHRYTPEEQEKLRAAIAEDQADIQRAVDDAKARARHAAKPTTGGGRRLRQMI